MYGLWWLAPVGLVVGAFGTLIGAGGGFLLVPLLLLIYPHDPPELIASISLAVVFFNAASGSIAYARMRRIDYRTALILAAATAPGAALGAFGTSALSRRAFDAVLGGVMLLLAWHLLRKPRSAAPAAVAIPDEDLLPALATPPHIAFPARRRFRFGMLLSMVAGYLSSLLGIGGGIVHVPLLVRVMRFPVHVATATSQLILAVMALAGTVVHLAVGNYSRGYGRTLALAVGVVVGAQFGAALSTRLRGAWILQSLALAIGFVGIRLLYTAWSFEAAR